MLVTGGSCIPLLGVRYQYRAGGGGVPDLPVSAVSFLFSGIRVYGCKTVFSVSGFLSFFPHCLSCFCRVVESQPPPIAFPSSSLGFVLIPTPLIQLLPHLVFATSPPPHSFPSTSKTKFRFFPLRFLHLSHAIS